LFFVISWFDFPRGLASAHPMFRAIIPVAKLND
jgi:hypothetical protein